MSECFQFQDVVLPQFQTTKLQAYFFDLIFAQNSNDLRRQIVSPISSYILRVKGKRKVCVQKSGIDHQVLKKFEAINPNLATVPNFSHLVFANSKRIS